MNMTKAEVREAIKDLITRDANTFNIFKDEEGVKGEDGSIVEDAFVNGLTKNFPFVRIYKRIADPDIIDVSYSDTKCKFASYDCEPGKYSINPKLMRFTDWFKHGYVGEPIDLVIMIPDIRVRLEIAPYDEMECLVMLLNEGRLVDVISNIQVDKKFIEVITKI